jgi:phosphoribosylanthranilate isomerase
MWIKICANTNLADAQLAAELGADAVGFVFAPSLRQVTPDEVAAITPHLPAHLERVGVFPASQPDAIVEDARRSGLTAIQLHGGLDLAAIERLNQLAAGQFEIIPVMHWQVGADSASAETVARQLAQLAGQGIVQRVLIDAKVAHALGGTGVAFNWQAARTVLSEAAANLKIIVAGGLRPENVAEAIEGLHPWGVDVASGVEVEPRRKSPEKLAAFLKNARG